jgi:hypothetical protein
MKAPGKSIKLAPPKEDEPTLDVTGKELRLIRRLNLSKSKCRYLSIKR